MKRIYLIPAFLIVMFFFFFYSAQMGIFKFGVKFPCSCLHADEITRWQVEKIKEILEIEKAKTGKYPDFNNLYPQIQETVVNPARRQYKIMADFNFYSDSFHLIKKAGVYYKVSEDGQSYLLQSYAKNELGMPVLIK